MKLSSILESYDEKKPITPTVKYRVNGDGSYTVRVDYGNGKVFVHSNKSKAALEKIVKEKYGPKVFS